MTLLGIGVDIQDLESIKRIFIEGDDRSYRRVFSEDEIQEFEENLRPDIKIAGKFAAKEAVFKCLSLDRNKGFLIDEIEIIREPSKGPECKFKGKVQEYLSARPDTKVMISISHTEDYAVAFAVYYD